jgi:XTP/dITP diphosphohydrolase
MRLVLATGNAGKLKELRELLAPLAFEVLPQSQFTTVSAAETGLTFVENAIVKARHAAQASGLPAIADDSGLEVDALDGAPGIHSARYAGDSASDAENLRKLLAALQGIAEVNAIVFDMEFAARHSRLSQRQSASLLRRRERDDCGNGPLVSR